MRKTTPNARALRQAATESEGIAWRLLRSLRLQGFKFRRQHPVGAWITDFCCPQRGLVVELEGSVHAQPSQARRDARRELALQRAGYAVLRLPNGIVLQDPEAFLRKVIRRAKELPNFYTGEIPPPHPQPLSPQGGEGRRVKQTERSLQTEKN